MRVRKLTLAAMALAAGLSLTACQNDDGTDETSAPPAASAPSSSDGGSGSTGSDQAGGQDSAGKSPNGTGGANGTGGGTGEDGTAAAKCRTDELEITAMDATVDGDTEGTVAVDLKNGGGRACTLAGYAGVDLKTNTGSLSAERTGEQAPPIVLKDGENVTFGITYPINNTGGSGVRITGLVVTPPNETKSVTLDWPGGASLPASDSPGSPVKVGPMGSAGQGG
ncbi:DUF4232 domain-containing protein [Streptomyces sp. ICN988]|jgi:hypothetical protein|uniref:DUF4232 domain-containing protein n=1 Tax=Streptomyces TaxID=1883 RepID=UPI000F6FFFE5|nr:MULTISPECIES: DUF4232 domain-containing protein [Streptomyces]AZM76352.1 DUF4232 domain-containing protein [Streptomyces sp. KPB2]MBH5135274.1 DUF4232 domain-containing protein [Streptomyces sp. HB-N217]MCV2463803.1 DUF4232 domain-containing protein [Streptomyces sp. ICN988]MDU0255362.1 DUF4232 domain-containing protein [Streptomyces sp. PU10]